MSTEAAIACHCAKPNVGPHGIRLFDKMSEMKTRLQQGIYQYADNMPLNVANPESAGWPAANPATKLNAP